MMDELRAFAFTIFAAGMTAALMQMIFPQGKLKKLMSAVLGLYVLLCVAAPLMDGMPQDLFYEFSQISEVEIQQAGESGAEEIYLAAAERELAKLVSNYLNELGIKTATPRISISIKEGKLSVDSVLVVLSPEESDRAGEVQQKLAQELRLPVAVTANER